MFRSVRARLTLWYVGALACILVVTALGVYALVKASVQTRLDSGLSSVIDVIGLSLQHEIQEHNGKAPGEEAFRGVMATVHQTSFPEQGIAVYDGARLVAAKPGADGKAPAHPGHNGASYRESNGRTFRVAARHVRMGEVPSGYDVIVDESTARYEEELASLRNVLVLLVPFALALAAAGGYFLARQSLAPVVAMADAVDRINSANLSTSLPVANPDDELGHLARTFNRLLERLDVAFTEQRRFMADASHELKTPISVSLTATQVTLENSRSPEEYREALEIVQRQLHRLGRVVQDMFLLARSDAGGYRFERHPIHLDDLVLDAAHDAAVLARPRSIHIEAGQLDEAPAVADEGMIRQALMILLDNAIKYSPESSTIRVELGFEPEYYRVSIRDEGPGIPAEAREHIFDRFYQVSKGRKHAAANAGYGGGAGLGLAIALWIAKAHQGSLELTSTGPQGSVFTLRIARPKPAAEDPGREEVTARRSATENGISVQQRG